MQNAAQKNAELIITNALSEVYSLNVLKEKLQKIHSKGLIVIKALKQFKFITIIRMAAVVTLMENLQSEPAPEHAESTPTKKGSAKKDKVKEIKPTHKEKRRSKFVYWIKKNQ